jgi:cobalt-precorrin-5B (C1)-methyltransferase
MRTCETGDMELRSGYTTGACAAAGAVAGYSLLRNGGKSTSIALTLPGGGTLDIPMASITKRADSVVSEVVKDAGDDPDVTDGITIRVEVENSTLETANAKDHIHFRGKGALIIRGGEGVGVATRPGLEVPVGKWAVNPGPRKMIVENLASIGFGESSECLIVEISAPNGAEISKRTLNPVLGVNGGISILGTTGIVVPYSNAAYVETIRIRVRCAIADGVDFLVFCTGSRTRDAVAREIRGLEPARCLRIGDFIGDTLKFANSAGLRRAVVACMPGKLYKYACGYEQTHAHRVKLLPDLMIKELKSLGAPESVLARIAECDTVGEAAAILEESTYEALLNALTLKASANLARWAPNVEIDLRVYDNSGNRLR